MVVHAMIPEFDKPADPDYFRDRYEGKKHVILIAYFNEEPIGYLIAYDKYSDGSIYCWMTGVVPQARKKGGLTKLMKVLEGWARTQGFDSIRIKTRNRRREMLSYLIKNDFLITEVLPEPKTIDHRILFKKKLS